MNIDDAVRELRHSVRGPADGLVQQIVTSAPSAGRMRSGHRVSGRTVLVAASVSVALVVAVALALLLGGADHPDPVPATPVIPPARVDWGMLATVRLTPDDGVSVEQMRERFAAALAFRTDDEGGAGVGVVSADGDEMTVRLPGAETRNQVDDYLRFLRLTIVDDAANLIATAPNIGALPEIPGKPGEPRGYYVQEQDPDGTWSAPQVLTSRKDMERWQAERGTRGAGLSVPVDMTIVGGREGGPVQLMRRTPLIPSSSIRGIRPDGDSVVVLTDPRQIDEDRWVSVFAGTGTAGEPDLYSERVGTGTLTRDGELRLPIGRWSLIPSAARPDLGGTTAVQRVSSYGAKVPEEFEDYRPSRGARQGSVGVPAASRWVRIASGRFDGRERLLLGAEYRGVLIATAFHEESLRYGYPNGGAHIVGTRNPGPLRSACPVGVGTPLVVRCGGAGGGTDRPKNGEVPLLYTDLGRVRPGVGRVAVRISGRYYDAVINDGWWMIWVEDEFPSVDDSPQGLGNMEIFNGATVLAWDVNGHPIPVPPRTVIRS